MATMEDFEGLDIRLGRVVEVADFPEARKPAYKLWIDFGEELGVKNHPPSSRRSIRRKNSREDSCSPW